MGWQLPHRGEQPDLGRRAGAETVRGGRIDTEAARKMQGYVFELRLGKPVGIFVLGKMKPEVQSGRRIRENG